MQGKTHNFSPTIQENKHHFYSSKLQEPTNLDLEVCP